MRWQESGNDSSNVIRDMFITALHRLEPILTMMVNSTGQHQYCCTTSDLCSEDLLLQLLYAGILRVEKHTVVGHDCMSD